MPEAYYHHGYGGGSWIAHAIARSLINRAVWSITSGMSPTEVVGLAVIAIIVVLAMSRA